MVRSMSFLLGAEKAQYLYCILLAARMPPDLHRWFVCFWFGGLNLAYHLSVIIKASVQLRQIYAEIKTKTIGVPHKTQLSRARVKLDMLLMRMRQQEFACGFEHFIYLSADASPQGSLEYFVVLEDRIVREFASLIVEATPEEREDWCKSQYLRTTPLPIAILGSGRATAPAKFEALAHAVMLDSMCGADPVHLTRYASSVISYCSDYGAESNLNAIPKMAVGQLLSSNVSNSSGLLTTTRALQNKYTPCLVDDVGIEDEVVFIPSEPQPDVHEGDRIADGEQSFFGLHGSLMIPGVKHLFDNVHKALLEVLRYYTTFFASGLESGVWSVESGGVCRICRVCLLKSVLCWCVELGILWRTYQWWLSPCCFFESGGQSTSSPA